MRQLFHKKNIAEGEALSENELNQCYAEDHSQERQPNRSLAPC